MTTLSSRFSTSSELGSGISVGERTETLFLPTFAVKATVQSEIEGFQYTRKPSTTRKTPKDRRNLSSKPKTTRRFKGFLVDVDAEMARVCLIEKDTKYFYDFPAENLRKAGIKFRNQPFQLDEFEMKTEEGGFSVGYTFTALADKKHAFVEALKNDEERRRKRDLIFKEFAKPAR